MQNKTISYAWVPKLKCNLNIIYICFDETWTNGCMIVPTSVSTFLISCLAERVFGVILCLLSCTCRRHKCLCCCLVQVGRCLDRTPPFSGWGFAQTLNYRKYNVGATGSVLISVQNKTQGIRAKTKQYLWGVKTIGNNM